MNFVSPKKHLGQHFLKDKNIANKIVESLLIADNEQNPIYFEIGPGTGVLSEFLIEKKLDLFLIEIDKESVDYLTFNYPSIKDKILNVDFLQYNLNQFNRPIHIIGNFPYNISSQIFFKVLEHRNDVKQVVGMLQKEVAQRIAEGPGTKTYGILSVLLQAFYDIEYLFTVNENVFYPPPKVKSAVIRLTRNKTEKLNCDEKLFFQVVKTAFNQRRKTIRNSVRSLFPAEIPEHTVFTRRPEQLSVEEFVELTKIVEKAKGV